MKDVSEDEDSQECDRKYSKNLSLECGRSKNNGVLGNVGPFRGRET